MIRSIDRRDFLKITGVAASGLILGVQLPPVRAESSSIVMNAYVCIEIDGAVTLYAPLADMGQGVFSSLPMLLAEELDLDWNSTPVVLASTGGEYANPARSEQYAASSRSIRGYFLPLRTLGAATRVVLLQAAAQQWGVAESECSTSLGRVLHKGSGRSLSYGELGADALKLTPPTHPLLKAREQFRLIGKQTLRKDVEDKVMGKQVFGIDVVRPGMRFAAIRQTPVMDQKVLSFAPPGDLDGVEDVYVLDDSALVALAETTWLAQHTLDRCSWELSESEFSGSSDESLRKQLADALDEPGELAPGGQPLPPISNDQHHIVTRQYSVPVLAHASLETPCCVAEWSAGKMHLWAPVQAPQRAARAVEEALGLRPENVILQQVFMGGSFGRKSESDFVVQAAKIARRTGGCVKLTWSRSEDLQQDFYRPAYMARMQASLGESSTLRGLSAKIAGEGILMRRRPHSQGRFVDPTAINHIVQNVYEIDALEKRFVRVPLDLRVGFWRSVSSSMNVFFGETFMNELASCANADPIGYRLSMLARDSRAAGVLRAVQERSLWQERGLQSNRFAGMALCTAYDSFVAQVIEIEAKGANVFSISRIYTAIDCGIAVDPHNVRAQVEGGTLFGLTAAIHGQIGISQGRVSQSNFHDYRLLGLADTPHMETVIIDSGEHPGGVGEVGLPAAAPALVAALHAATGEWQRDLPLARSAYQFS
ncbi:MAG: isoquinoline 1-oxidoreductase beta subunit [Halieaceae bacterium]|jgi:isoquinoline 1-oxidoreductase beta subunit